jgi:hypothetical protein
MRASEFITEIAKKYANMIPPPHWKNDWPVVYREIYDRYKRGESISDIQKSFSSWRGINVQQVIDLLNNYVPKTYNMKKFSTYRQQFLVPAGVVDLYSKGKTPTDIANFYRIPLEQVINTLKAQGITGRTFKT